MRPRALAVLALVLAALAPASRPAAAGTDAPASAPSAGVAGEWTTTINTQNGPSAMTVNLGQAGGRWVGTYDLEHFPIRDVAIQVTVTPDSVILGFSGLRLDFRGTLSADGHRLIGALGPADSVVFERAGHARFADQFIEREEAEEDSTAVLPLSSDARELRAAFDRDTAQVRLLLLLSPT